MNRAPSLRGSPRSTSRRSSLALLLLGPLLSACHDSSGNSSFLPPGVTALGFAADDVSIAGGVLSASDFEAGDDHNGDGDGDDTLLHVLDLASGRSTLVPDVERVSGGGDGFVAFTVAEEKAGSDLNGDGDVLDAVLHVVDGRSGAIANVGLAADWSDSPVQSGKWIGFGVPESDQGGLDIDGDGEASSEIAHVHDASKGVTTALPIPISPQSGAIHVRESWLVVVGDEDHRADFNGDGDRIDSVVFTHDLLTGTTENLGHAIDGIFAFDGRLLASHVNEFEHSGDLNGDGDESDHLVELVALEMGARHLLDEGVFVRVGGGLAFVQMNGRSLLYDELTDEFVDLSALPLREPPRLSGRHAAMLVEEFVAGDANHDGDTSDGVLFVFDSRSSTMTNTAIAVLGDFEAFPRAFDVDGARSVYLYSESRDRGEASLLDTVARIRDHRRAAERDLGPAERFFLEDGLVIVSVTEQRLGEDRNGDLDEDDTILRIHDPARGTTFDTGLAVSPFLEMQDGIPKDLDLEGRHVVVRVPESLTGEDGNGDGDFLDETVFAMRVP